MTIELPEPMWLYTSNGMRLLIGKICVVRITYCSIPKDYIISSFWMKRKLSENENNGRSQFPIYTDIEQSKKWAEENILPEFIKRISKNDTTPKVD